MNIQIMQFIRSAIIPVVCVGCVALGIYLVQDTDKRWERERLGLPSERKTSDRSGDEPNSQTSSVFSDQADHISPPKKDRPETEISSDQSDSEKSGNDSPPVDRSADVHESIPKQETALVSPTNPQTQQSTPHPTIESRNLDANAIGTSTLQVSSISRSKILSSPRQTPSDGKNQEEIEKDTSWLETATSAIVSIRRADDSPMGCGVIVSIFENGFDVLTADHLFATPEPFSVTTYDRDSPTSRIVPRTHRSVKILKQSSALDLAMIRVHTATAPEEFLRLAEPGSQPDASSMKGWAVYCDEKRNPHAEEVTIVNRQIAKRTKDSAAVSYWRIERPSAPGWSGSALIDQRGRLIGIASGNSKGIAYYCDLTELTKFLRE